jgi:hypothetical protein
MLLEETQEEDKRAAPRPAPVFLATNLPQEKRRAPGAHQERTLLPLRESRTRAELDPATADHQGHQQSEVPSSGAYYRSLQATCRRQLEQHEIQRLQSLLPQLH